MGCVDVGFGVGVGVGNRRCTRGIHYNQTSIVLYNQGSSEEGYLLQSLPSRGLSMSRDLALVDLNSDGLFDIIVSTSAENENYILQNKGESVFDVLMLVDGDKRDIQSLAVD